LWHKYFIKGGKQKAWQHLFYYDENFVKGRLKKPQGLDLQTLLNWLKKLASPPSIIEHVQGGFSQV
jgi:hypothetical protein